MHRFYFAEKFADPSEGVAEGRGMGEEFRRARATSFFRAASAALFKIRNF